MKSFAEQQARIDARRTEAMGRYPEMWTQLLGEWRSHGREDRAWLTYCANYLMRTGNVRWALDPLLMHDWLADDSSQQTVAELEGLSFVLLTHEHDDHLDRGLIRSLRDLPIRWVVPEAILSLVLETGLSRDNIIVPKMLVPLEIEGISILPFAGMHWENVGVGAKGANAAGKRGVPATSYLVEFSGKRWLFPGDVRTYATGALPTLGQIDGLFAHLWLGRGSALVEPPPLLDAFCKFCVETGAKRVVITHLEEFGRDANDLWDAGHAQEVLSRLHETALGLFVTSAYMGESIEL